MSGLASGARLVALADQGLATVSARPGGQERCGRGVHVFAKQR